MASDFVGHLLNLPEGGNFDLLHIYMLVIQSSYWALGITRHVSITGYFSGLIVFLGQLLLSNTFGQVTSFAIRARLVLGDVIYAPSSSEESSFSHSSVVMSSSLNLSPSSFSSILSAC